MRFFFLTKVNEAWNLATPPRHTHCSMKVDKSLPDTVRISFMNCNEKHDIYLIPIYSMLYHIWEKLDKKLSPSPAIFSGINNFSPCGKGRHILHNIIIKQKFSPGEISAYTVYQLNCPKFTSDGPACSRCTFGNH